MVVSGRLADTVFHTLEKSIKTYRQFAQSNIVRAGLDITVDQWLVLKTLQDNPDATQQEVAGAVFKDFASITRIIALLAAKGLLRRSPHPVDKRRSALALTPKGLALISRLEPLVARNRQQALAGIDEAELARAQRVLKRIVANCRPSALLMKLRVAAYCLGLIMLSSAPGSAQGRAQPLPLTPHVRRAVVDSVRSAVLRTYVFADTARAMTDYLAERARSGAYDTVSNPNALAARLTRDLRHAHNDSHLRIVYDPQEAARAADTTHREARDRLAMDRKQNFFFRKVAILPGNIGYLDFWQFPDTSVEARKTVRAAMQFVANTEYLIIDLRDNRGGSAAMANEIVSYFMSGAVHWGNSYNRVTDRWTKVVIENKPDITGGVVLSMPIVILTSSWTYSAAEGLAYGLKHNRQARVVGQPTGGGAHVLRRVGLGNGYVGFIPYVRFASSVTKTDWEGTGVRPDVSADAPDALLRAQETILAERLAAATDTTAQRAAQWAINDARAEAHRVDVPVATLEKYAGRFEEYTFSVRDGRLHVVNSSRDDKANILAPVTQTLFKLDSESQVEFVADQSGQVNALRLLWNDGWVDALSRAQ